MFEEKTCENILADMLASAPDGISAERGSLFYDAVTPVAAELAKLYAAAGKLVREAFADTASEEYLLRHAAVYGITRVAATGAIVTATFDVPIPYDTKFYLRGYIYASRDFIEMSGSNYIYALECETAGSAPNSVTTGTLKPISYIDGLSIASFGDITTPGVDRETLDSLRSRVLTAKRTPAFGGNRADYKKYAGTLSGVGGVKIYPGTGGGVSVVIQSASGGVPTSAVIAAVKTALDPADAAGQGCGIAPIGHSVTVTGVTEYALSVKSDITLASGWTTATATSQIRQALKDYIADTAALWADSDGLVLRISALEDYFLSLRCVSAVSGTIWLDTSTSAYTANNLVLGANVIPVFHAMTLL